jgi:hypothetical protein
METAARPPVIINTPASRAGKENRTVISTPAMKPPNNCFSEKPPQQKNDVIAVRPEND